MNKSKYSKDYWAARAWRAESQRAKLREALEDAVSEVEVMKNEIGYRAATIDVIADCRAALEQTKGGE